MPIYNSNVYKGKEARDMLVRGIDVVADAVMPTLGAKGSNAVLQEDLPPYHSVTNDGVSVAEKVFSSHPVEALGVSMMKEVAGKANRQSGDGTTTAVTMTHAIVHGAGESHGVVLMRSLQACLPAIDASLDAQKREIRESEVGAAATISAEDPKLGAMLQEILMKIGKDGIIELDNSGTPEDSWTETDGVRLRGCGYMSPHMANDGQKASYRDPKILITRQRIATLTDIDHLFGLLSGQGVNELVMFVDDIDPQVVAALAYTHANGIFKTLIIKAPTLWKDWLFEDFARITGATIVEPSTGVTLKTATEKHLGTCSRLVADREDTVVTGIRDISAHVAILEGMEDDQSKLRLAWLKTKAATLRIGASSETELSYRRRKAEDARNASWLALRHGVVPGGGIALKNAAQDMPDTEGGRILREVLKAPFNKIIQNAGLAPMEIPGQGPTGVDVLTGKTGNMFDMGVVDPVHVVKGAVRSAISVASAVLSAETVTVHPDKKP